ncbi:RES domain-containing protein [Streptomyces canus]|uniref:RES domain-containing protein n=1 Tax=Streptomyces canus TaxID=58343 RepID=UPI00358F0E9B
MASFPRETIGPGQTLFRAHKTKNPPPFYCVCGDCRFDPPATKRRQYGSCCAAYEREIALLEHLAGVTTVNQRWVEQREISPIKPTVDHKVAHLPQAITGGEWGIDEDLQVGVDRRLSKGWGAAFREADFQGVLHASRRDPVHAGECVAFFGTPPGENHSCLARGVPEKITTALRVEMARRFNIHFFPPAPLV